MLSQYKNIKKRCIVPLLFFGIWPGIMLYGQNADTAALQPPNITDSVIDSSKATHDTLATDTAAKAVRDTMISSSPLEARVQYKSKDSVIFYLNENKAILYDKAQVNYKKIQLKSGKIIMDWQTNTVHTRGLKDSAGNISQRPVFKEKQQQFEADSIDYNFSSKKGKLYGLKTKQAQGYLHGKEVKKDQYDVTYASEARYTTCDKEDPHFYLQANKIKAIPNDKIISGPAHLVMGDVPLPLFLPFGFFPNTESRSSGLIIPSYGESRERGFYLRGLGYYFGISENLDLRFNGDIYSNGSWRASVGTRYVKRYQYDGNLQLGFGISKFGLPTDPNFRRERSFKINWSHNQAQNARPYSNFNANVEIMSKNANNDQQLDLNQKKKNTLSSSINYRASLPGTKFSLNAGAGHNQNLASNQFSLTLPRATLDMSRLSPFQTADKGYIKNIGVNYDLNFKNRLNTTDTALFERNTWSQFKTGLRQNASISTSAPVLKYFSLKPSIEYHESFFFQKQRKLYFPESDSLGIQKRSGFFSARSYSFNTSLNTNVYGTFNINEMGIEAVRHAFNPSLSFNYRPDFSAPRFGNYGHYRDTAGERRSYSFYPQGVYANAPQGERGALGIALNNNLEMKVRNSQDTAKDTRKISILDRFNIRTNYNFLAESFPLDNIRFTGNTRILSMLDINFNGTIDPYYLNPEDSTRVERLSINENGKIGRLTNFKVSLNTSLNPKVFSGEERQRRRYGVYRPLADIHYMDFELPWNLSLGYNLTYSKPQFEGRIARNSINASGNIKLTDKMKIRGRTSYNMQEKEFNASQVSIHRDLHCWEMSIRWQPFTSRGSYMFTIRAKSSVLRDLKYEKRRQNY